MPGCHIQMWELEEVQKALRIATYEMSVHLADFFLAFHFEIYCLKYKDYVLYGCTLNNVPLCGGRVEICLEEK